ncbi:hypothetical protein Egran_00855 [Elaphomyces granulatus]|uniref:Mitochondrial zinc maintenance protein 1, mitochondrial n=1 Tax=Elaphomyces granulatus TaxID=519963 RepID=A0A232M532_9EURO|nr:hypothetical protein Egran_00855 [Elaphomyces granulatus]
MASQPSVFALSAYRCILRATRIAFRDDYNMLYAARNEARRRFEESRFKGVDSGMLIQDAFEIAEILKHNIVQGARDVDREDAKWKLRIHDEIELGDNDSVKLPGGKTVKVDKSCCS